MKTCPKASLTLDRISKKMLIHGDEIRLLSCIFSRIFFFQGRHERISLVCFPAMCTKWPLLELSSYHQSGVTLVYPFTLVYLLVTCFNCTRITYTNICRGFCRAIAVCAVNYSKYLLKPLFQLNNTNFIIRMLQTCFKIKNIKEFVYKRTM